MENENKEMFLIQNGYSYEGKTNSKGKWNGCCENDKRERENRIVDRQ